MPPERSPRVAPWFTMQAAIVAACGLGAAPALVAGCASPSPDLADDPQRYLDDVDYRRGILERDLTPGNNDYTRVRLQRYGRSGEGWEILPERDPPSLPLAVEVVQAYRGGAPLAFDDARATRLAPAEIPASEEAWIALGRRVFFEYPISINLTYTALISTPDGLETTGFLTDQGAWVGLRLLRDEDGTVRVGRSCSHCHASFAPTGKLDGALSNRALDLGHAKLAVLGAVPLWSLPELEETSLDNLERLGPGRTDSLVDGVFNPYRFPDFGGLRDQPYLNHTANWVNRGTATLALRAESLFTTANGQVSRIPRVLSWALAVYLRSLPPPPPLDAVPAPEAEKGKAVFDSAGCSGCHVPPLYTSDQLIPLDTIGTDPAAGRSRDRGTGFYRIPSLRGVARKGPYLHHGPFKTLEEMFTPGRSEPGHTFGLELDASDRAALLAFLRSI